MKSLDSSLLRDRQDCSYGRLLRRLDQAMDIACTRQWMDGCATAPDMLEVQGLSRSDLLLLQQILCNLDGSCAASPEVIAALDRT